MSVTPLKELALGTAMPADDNQDGVTQMALTCSFCRTTCNEGEVPCKTYESATESTEQQPFGCSWFTLEDRVRWKRTNQPTPAQCVDGEDALPHREALAEFMVPWVGRAEAQGCADAVLRFCREPAPIRNELIRRR